LEPFRAGDRVKIHGQAAAIKPAVAQNFALAIHELATNAAKYGALSSQNGRLDVSWTLAPGGLVLIWSESGGPNTGPPTKKGFGTKVIEASIKNQLTGVIETDWSSGSLICTLRVPAEHFSEAIVRSTGEPEEEDDVVEPRTSAIDPRISGRRILLVEDEPLVAMMMTQMIGDMGGEVIGPFGTLRDAIEALPEKGLDAAVLDVNVGGELVYPLAERLARDGTPLMFLTGYDSKSVDRRFVTSRVLTKPIEEAELASALASLLEAQPKARARA
ncbi:MAG: response regulator, partial [Myxococcota bacterium]